MNYETQIFEQTLKDGSKQYVAKIYKFRYEWFGIKIFPTLFRIVGNDHCTYLSQISENYYKFDSFDSCKNVCNKLIERDKQQDLIKNPIKSKRIL